MTKIEKDFALKLENLTHDFVEMHTKIESFSFDYLRRLEICANALLECVDYERQTVRRVQYEISHS